MKLDREFVLTYLNGKQIGQGGHYGTDLSDLAKVVNVTYRAVRMRIRKWIKEEPDFFNLIYLGKSPPSITLDEFIEIKKKQRQVKLLFVVDGTQSIQKFSEEIKGTIDRAMETIRSRFAGDDSYTFSYGCVMYWDKEFKKRTDKIGWVSNEKRVTSFIRNYLDNPPGNPNDDHEELMMEGLDVALRSFSFEPLESNFIMLIGDAGSRQDEYNALKASVVQKLSESYSECIDSEKLPSVMTPSSGVFMKNLAILTRCSLTLFT